MDFLLIRSASADDAWLRRRLPRLRLCQPGTLSVEEAGPARLYHFGTGAGEGSVRHHLFGAAFESAAFLTELRPPGARALEHFWRALEAGSPEVAGSFCCVRLERGESPVEGWAEVRTDPFNAYPVFWTEAGDLWAVSNNVHMLRAVLDRAGRTAELDLLPKVCALAIGSDRQGRTAWRGIEVLRDCARIEAGERLRVVSETAEVLGQLSEGSYGAAIEGAAERLEARLGALAREYGEGDAFFDVTGGLDSRMLFAGLLAAGVAGRWPFRNFSAMPNPDAHYAAVLAERHGLRQVAGLDSLLHKLVTREEAWRIETYMSMGFSPKTGGDPLRRFPDQLHLHGGFGEIGGVSPDGKRFIERAPRQETDAAGLAAVYAADLGRTGLMGMFAPAVRAAIEDEIRERLSVFIDRGARPTHAPILFYANAKMRTHFGLISRLQGQARAHPDCLYDPGLMAAALRLPMRPFLKGRANFDLIRRLGGDDLAAMPIADGAWDRAALPRDAEPATFIRPKLTRQSPQLFGKEPERVPFGQGARVLTATDHAGSRERRAADPAPSPPDGLDQRTLRARQYQAFVRERLGRAEIAERLFETFDSGAVRALVSMDDAGLAKWCNRVTIHALAQCAILAEGSETSIYDLD